MTFFTDLAKHVDALRDALGEDVSAERMPPVVSLLSDDDVVGVLEWASAAVRALEAVRIAAAGVVAARSRRVDGHGGLAQKRGHRSPAALVQELTGSTRGDAAKHVRLGESLVAGVEAERIGRSVAPPALPERRWDAVLIDAHLVGRLTSAQHDAIQRGLGEPPTSADESDAAAARDAWAIAAAQLAAEAAERTVEELVRAARTVRDLLDPAGAEHRFDERFERRSFRSWIDGDGMRHAAVVFDDHGGAWLQSILDNALRPRRGGPRFVDAEERARGDELASDPRTNDQLAYDLFIDVMRAGALADAEAVFGTRQAAFVW